MRIADAARIVDDRSRAAAGVPRDDPRDGSTQATKATSSKRFTRQRRTCCFCSQRGGSRHARRFEADVMRLHAQILLAGILIGRRERAER